MSALLARWRASLLRGDAGEHGQGSQWPPKVLAARAAAVLFWLCAVSSLVSLVWPSSSGGQLSRASVAAAVAAGAGLVSWFLPWDRWPRWASLFLVPVGFASIALQSTVAGPGTPVSSVLFVLLFAWIGVALPRGTALLALPLFAAAYLLPSASSGQSAAPTVVSTVYLALACLLVGELPALLCARLHRSRGALRRARAAVNGIGAELASAADPEKSWSSIALRLSDVAGLPDCDIYRLADGGSLICVASVYDDEPCPDYLGPRPEQDVWAVDGRAVLTKEPIFIASPADPRLGTAEREDMRAWREQAMLIVPLVARGEVVGLVEISETRAGRSITPEQVATVVSVCPLIAMALHDAGVMRAHDEDSRGLAEVPKSSRVVGGAASTEEPPTVVKRGGGDASGDTESVARARSRGGERPSVEAGVLPSAAERQQGADELAPGEPARDKPAPDRPATDKPATGKPAPDESAAPRAPTAGDGGAIDQAEMRRRIEETRTRLKVKAFDAMIRGGAALLSRDGDDAPAPTGDEPSLDGDLEGMVDGAFSEQEY